MIKSPLNSGGYPNPYTNTDYGTDTFGIQSFKKHFRDLARPNRFKVLFRPPSIFATDFSDEFMSSMVKRVNMPAYTVNELLYERAGKKLHIPAHIEFTDLSITFFNDVDQKMKNIIHTWQNMGLSNWEFNTGSIPLLALQGQIEVHQYDGNNQSTGAVVFTNCWPKSMSNIDFGHESDNTVSDFTVDWYYTEQQIFQPEAKQ